jgi:hypothetical protein
MTLRGNFQLFFVFEIAAGIATFALCYLFGDIGLLGLSLFFLGMIITMNPKPDEREIQLIFKAGNIKNILVIVVMGLIYYYSLPLNWFHVLVSSALFFRGSFGLYYFLTQ